MKRFLVLLVLIAGGLAAASLSVPSNAAVVNGQAISQDQLTSDVSAIANSPAYRCYLNAQLASNSQGQSSGTIAFDGAGQQTGNAAHATATASFVTSQLNTEIEGQIVSQVAAEHHVHITPGQLRTARQQFGLQFNRTVGQATGQCAATTSDPASSVPARLVQQQVQFFATVTALEQKLSGIGSSNADLKKFFDSNRSIFDQVCFTAATFSSVNAAQTARAALYEGATFASIAAKTPSGGPQGCEVLYNVVTLLPPTANLQGLPVNTPSQPIVFSNGEVVLLEVTARSPNQFSSVKTVVQQAAGTVALNQTGAVISAARQKAHVVVNPRYGAWMPTTAQVLDPALPSPSNVINTGANAPDTTASGISAPSSSSGRFG